MRDARFWLFGTVVLVLVAAAILTLALTPPTSAAPREGPGAHWRYHDGHWSYWDSDDKRWYYTDGSHWYYHDKDAWLPYRFDRHYGREHFERGDYKFPERGAKIELPRHRIYVAPR